MLNLLNVMKNNILLFKKLFFSIIITSYIVILIIKHINDIKNNLLTKQMKPYIYFCQLLNFYSEKKNHGSIFA